jgi:cytochrome d ubiquinol oxidase subunit II
VQGLTVGALVEGLPMVDGHYVGGTFGWFSPFDCLCGIGLCFGYTLLGAGWLVLKCEGSLRDRFYTRLRPLTVGVFGFLAIAFVYALALNFRIMDRWLERPYLLVFPALGAVAAVLLVRGIKNRRDGQPFRMTALIFLSAFGTLAVSFWPFMITFAVTIDEAAAQPSSLRFMFWGAGLFVLPLTLIYTATVYRVFGGKVVGGSNDH